MNILRTTFPGRMQQKQILENKPLQQNMEDSNVMDVVIKKELDDIEDQMDNQPKPFRDMRNKYSSYYSYRKHLMKDQSCDDSSYRMTQIKTNRETPFFTGVTPSINFLEQSNSINQRSMSMDHSYESRHDEFIDEDFFYKQCKGIQVTNKIDKQMIIEFVQNTKFFSQIQMVFGMDETNRLHLYGLYQQATKGDFDENAHKGLLSMFSGPNNFEKIAWKKHKGMPREVAMHNWVFETKKITDLFSTEKLCNICRDDKRLREKPSIKSLKIFQSYLDHFLVIQREHRHYTQSFRTETLQSITKSQIDDNTEDNALISRKTTTFIDKNMLKPLRLQAPRTEKIQQKDILQKDSTIKFEELKSKIIEINVLKDMNQQDLDNQILQEQKSWRSIAKKIYSRGEIEAVIKIQTRFRAVMMYKTMVNRFSKISDINQFKALLTKERIQTSSKKKEEDSGDESQDHQQREKHRQSYHDFWIGKMLAQFPHHFIDMRLQHLNIEGKTTSCKNCKQVINADRVGVKVFWFSPKFGYFCNSCLHPQNNDFLTYMLQIKQSETYYPSFDGLDRVKENAIKIKKNRPSTIKGFCYQNQDKHIRKTIFPQKWHWRINERRNVLKDHKFLNSRPKRTQQMDDLKKKWPRKLQKYSVTLIKGYKKKIDDETRIRIKEQKKLYDYERRMTGINVIHFKHIKNIAIMTFKGVYENAQELKEELIQDFSVIVQKESIDKAEFEGFKWVLLLQSDYQKHFVQDQSINRYQQTHLPLCYIKTEHKLGFIQAKNSVLATNFIVIEAMAQPRDIILVPSSSLYESTYENNKKEHVKKYRQCFNLCFFIAPNFNNKFQRGRRYKNRGILQIFEVEADWTIVNRKLRHSQLNVINQKLILNVNIQGEESVHQNFQPNGIINGIKIFDEISSKLLVLERTLPFEFTFQNEVIFSRYQKFYKHPKPYRNDKSQILLIESQLTTKSKVKLYSYQQIMVLTNAIKVIINHVPYDQKEFEKYEFIEAEDQAIQLFMKQNNWLQPLGALGCRSMASFMFQMENFNDNFDTVLLKARAQNTLIEYFQIDQPKLFKTTSLQEIMKPYMLEPDEMSTDLSCRNPIHDALDQDRLFELRGPIATMLEFVGKSKNTSNASREILTGLMHRILADQNNNLKQHYKWFFIDSPEDKKQFSKFSVKFNENHVQRYSNNSHRVNYYNDITHIDPEITISNTYEERSAQVAKLSRSTFLMRKKSRRQSLGDTSPSPIKDIDVLKEDQKTTWSPRLQNQAQRIKQHISDSKKTKEDLQLKINKVETIYTKTMKSFTNHSIQTKNTYENIFNQPAVEVDHPLKKQSVELTRGDRLGDSDCQDSIHEESKVGLVHSVQIDDPERSVRIELSEGDANEDRERGITFAEGGEPEGSDSSDFEDDTASSGDEMEGGAFQHERKIEQQDSISDEQETEANEEEAVQNDSDDENGFTVEHYYVDFRHVFLQANLQNILGFPRYQSINDASTGQAFTQKILRRFYETEGFRNNTETTQVVSLIYKYYQDEIENMVSLKMLTDCQFVDTVKIIRALSVVYILLMVLPFSIQLYTNNTALAFWCLIPMIVMNIFLLGLELLQMRQLTWNIYKREKWNFVELLSVVLTFVYVLIRAIFIEEPIMPDSNSNQRDANVIAFWVVFNTVIFILQVMKLLYFMRVSMNMAKIVKLTMRVFSDVAAFTIYLIIWITVFVQLYQIAGLSLFTKTAYLLKYNYVSPIIALWLQTFRNSLGDISEPTVEYWTENPTTTLALKQTFTYWAWTLFLIHEFFLCVCLLNFLIAIVSQSYDAIMDNQVMETVMSKIYLNNEAAMIFDAIDLLIRLKRPPSQTFHMIVCVDQYTDSSNNGEFQGFVRTMKLYFQKESKITRRQLAETKGELEQKIADSQQQNKEMFETIMQQIDKKFIKLAHRINSKEDIYALQVQE